MLQPGTTSSEGVHVISCYAPTYAASRVIKENFLDDLQQALDSISPSKFYIIMGDFNARAGSRTSENDHWASARGLHGLQETNEAGMELLIFLSTTNQLLCIKLRVKERGGHHRQARSSGGKKFAVENLISRTENNSTYRDT